MKKFYYQTYFLGQDEYITDTAEFLVPDTTDGEQIATAIDAGMNALDLDDYDDRIDYANDVYQFAVEQLGGTWRYIDIIGVMEVE